MIIVKCDVLNVKGFKRAEPILFVDEGAYSYVESAIVENEIRVCQNWERAEGTGKKEWIVGWSQGTEIPQELGDWLVAHQDNKQAPDKTEKADN